MQQLLLLSLLSVFFFLGVERKKMKCSKTRDNSTKNVEYHGQVICLMHLTSFFFFFKLKLFDLLEPGGGIFWPDCPQLENNKTTGNSIYICVSIQKGQPHLTTKLGGNKKKAVSSFHLIQLVFYPIVYSFPPRWFFSHSMRGDRQSVAAPFSSSSSIRRHHMRIKSRRGFFSNQIRSKSACRFNAGQLTN